MNGNSVVSFTPLDLILPTITLTAPAQTAYQETNEDGVVYFVNLAEPTISDITVAFEFSGSAVAGSDFRFVPDGQVTIAAGQTSAPIIVEIINDNEFEPNLEDLVLTLTSATNAEGSDVSAGIDTQNSSATITIESEDEEPVTRPEFTVEAEDFTGLANQNDFKTNFAIDASEFALIRLPSGGSGTVETELPQDVSAGLYTIRVHYFDENDGQSSASASINGELLGNWTFDNDGAGNAAQASNLRIQEFTNVQIDEGAIFSLSASQDQGEFARFDRVDFIRTGDVPLNGAPVGDVPDTVVAEGANVDIPFGFTDPEQEDISYTATLVGGAALPDWLVLGTEGLTGTPPAGLAGQVLQIEVTATDTFGNQTVDTFELSIEGPTDAFAPNGDLDDDGIINSADADIDGDSINNVDDDFAYDAQNGVLLAEGEEINLTFDVDGTPYQNGLTGLLQSPTAGFEEETGTATVSGGKLNIIASNGDTGSSNTPEDDFQLGVKNGAFTVEARIDNPFFGASAENFDQVGIHVGLDSKDFVKLVFGFSSEVVEFSKREANAETKATGGNQDLPSNAGLADFAYADLTLDVTSQAPTSATITAAITFYADDGSVLADNVPFGSLPISGDLALALADSAVGVGAGITQTQFGGPDVPFTVSVDQFKVTGGAETGGNDGSVLDILGGIQTNASYNATDVGSAIITITPNGSIQSSNYTNDSFQVENTGDKKIAAVFIDVRDALYTNSVFDPDGNGGDNVAKPWAVNSGQTATGAFIPGSGYFFPGAAPVADPENPDANGGFKGAIVQFTDFDNGETVGFSGDMDPNSIAGRTKSEVDAEAINSWDVGGISGAEIIGSQVYVLFDDGSVASSQLHGTGSQSGSAALITEASENKVATLDVTTDAPGVYGAVPPTVILNGTPGDTVRVILTKGFDPVNSSDTQLDQLVADRLAQDEFGVSNAFEFQFEDVLIPASGTIDISGAFTYAQTENGVSFNGDAIQPIAFVAAVIDPASGLAIGPVTDPVRLVSNGTPVDDDAGGNNNPPADGYYLVSDERLKVQFEDLGENPGSDWSFFNSADEVGNQANFQGAGYYEWKDGGYGPNGEVKDAESINGPQGPLEYTFVIPEGQEGEYTLRLRVSRDSEFPNDQRNDVWVNIDDDTENLLTSSVDAVNNGQFIKVYGKSNGDFGFAGKVDSQSASDPNFDPVFTLGAGTHTITFAGRSSGYHLDFFELYQGSKPALDAPDSEFIEAAPATSSALNVIDTPADGSIDTLADGSEEAPSVDATSETIEPVQSFATTQEPSPVNEPAETL